MLEQARENLLAGRPWCDGLDGKSVEALQKRYSHFEDSRDRDGFVVSSIHVVDEIITPRPFLHLIASLHKKRDQAYGSFWSQVGRGFSCLDSVLAGPITSHADRSYVPTAPGPKDFRAFVLREMMPDGPRIWYLNPQIGRGETEYEDFRCEQGLGYVSISAGRYGIESEFRCFVPVDDPLEAWMVTLEETEGRDRKISLFVDVKWDLCSYPSHYFDPRIVSKGRIMKDLNAQVAINNDQKNKHPRTGFLMSSDPMVSYDMSCEDFDGGGHLRIFPKTVFEGRLSGSTGIQPYSGLVSAMQVDVDVPSNGKKQIYFLLGCTQRERKKCRDHLATLRKSYFSGGFQKEFRRTASTWKNYVMRSMCKTGDEEFDRFHNVWSKYQAQNSSRFTRALDKVGYRDILQDLIGIVSFNPEYIRTMLPVALSYQLRDGRAVRQFPKFKGGDCDMRMYMDSSSWIPDTLITYIEETGDFSILEERVPYFDPESQTLRKDWAEPIFEHAVRAVKALANNRGYLGFCNVGHGDWNDALDGLSRTGEGVSVWLSCAFIFAATRLAKLAVRIGDTGLVSYLESQVADMTDCINRNAWDEDHYIYAFTDRQTPVGSYKNREGKIHLNVNSWAMFTGVSDAAGRTAKVLQGIKQLETPIGHVLLSPPYTAKSRKVGRIADMVPGQFENGSVYTHGQAFLAYALLCQNRADEAYAELKKMLPNATLPDLTTGPRHQLTNFAVGPSHPHFGRHLYSNFTGSLCWIRRSMALMLGVTADFDELKVNPCAPSCWKKYTVRRVYRKKRYEISVSAPGKDGRRRAKIAPLKMHKTTGNGRKNGG